MVEVVKNEEIYFTSNLFQIVKGEEEDTNPGRYGKELGTWLCERLRSRGYHEAEVFPEDWGWCVMCSRQPFMLWVGCGSMPTEEVMNSTSEDPPATEKIVWTAYPIAEIPFFFVRAQILKLLGKIETEPSRQKLLNELRDILSSDSDIHFVDDPK